MSFDPLAGSIDHATANMDKVMEARIRQLNDLCDDKIRQVKDLLNGVKITAEVHIDIPEVKKGERSA